MTGDLGAIVNLLRERETFFIYLHQFPDGDAIGSSLGLAGGLRQLGKEVYLVSRHPLPEQYRFLPGSEGISDRSPLQEGSVVVLLDCTGLDRAGLRREGLGAGTVVVNIDHHASNGYFGDLNLVDPHAAAVGELVYYLLDHLGVEIDGRIATCLYAAILTDTGCFSFENTTSRSLEVAARLVEKGARPYEVAQEIYESRPASSLRLLSRALGSLELSPGGRVGWMTVTREMIEDTGATDGDSDGVANYARAVRGVELGILFRELPDGMVKVGLRSRGQVDVSQLAASFGVGGHPRAAGCVLPGPVEVARREVLEAALKAVGEGARLDGAPGRRIGGA